MNNSSSPTPAFPHGLRVFLRTSMPNGDIHNIDFPQGRSITLDERMDILTVLNEEGEFIGAFSRDSFSFILPLIIVGPGPSDEKN